MQVKCLSLWFPSVAYLDLHTPGLLGWVKCLTLKLKIDYDLIATQDGLGVGEMGFIFCGKHPLLVTGIQVSDPGPIGPLVLKKTTSFLCTQFDN